MAKLISKKTNNSDNDFPKIAIPVNFDDTPFLDPSLLKTTPASGKTNIPKYWDKTKKTTKRIIEGELEFVPSHVRGANVSIQGIVYDEEWTPEIRQFAQANALTQYFQATPQTGNIHHLLTRALTHVSYGTKKVKDNETLVFIGRNALELFIGENLHQSYSSSTYGTFKSLSFCRALYINYLQLAHIGRQWNISPALRVIGFQTMSLKTKNEIISNAVTAIVGAIYTAHGPSVAKDFVNKNFRTENPSQVFQRLLSTQDNVELLSALFYAQHFTYPKKIIHVAQSDNTYHCSYYNGTFLIGFGKAVTQDRAEKLAASNSLCAMAATLPDF